jgi:hypothetical protein
MRKITLLVCALIVSLAATAQNPRQLWTSSDYSWNTGDHSRDIAVYNGKIYVTDNNGANSAVHVIDAATGVEDTGAAIVNENFTAFGIAADNAGHLLVPKNTGGPSSWILSKVDLATGTVTVLNGGTAISSYRTDYIRIKGNLEATDQESYIIGASTNNPQIQAWEAKAGDLTATAPFVWARPAGASAADIEWIDDTHIFLTQQAKIPILYTVDFTNPAAYISNPQEIGSATTTIGGGAYFVLDGTPYMAISSGTEAARGAIEIFNVSDPQAPVAVGSVTPAIGSANNASVHLGIEAIVTATDKATIYVWAPNNGAAAYEFTTEPVGIKDITPKAAFNIKPTAGGIEIGLNGVSTVELFSVNGALIDKAVATGTYACALTPGVYIVRINGKAVKFVK